MRRVLQVEQLIGFNHTYQFNSIQFNSIQFIDQLRALKGQQENCTYMNKQYAQ